MDGWLLQKRGGLGKLADSTEGELAEKKLEEEIMGALLQKNQANATRYGHKEKNASAVPLESALCDDADAKSAFSSSLWKSRLAYFAASKWENGLFAKIEGEKKAQVEILVQPNCSAYYVLLYFGENCEGEVSVRINGKAQNAGIVEAVLGENARANVSVLGVQAEGSKHYLQACASVGRDAKMQWFASSFGGDGSVHAKNQLIGQGANCENFGVFFPKEKEKMVVRTATAHKSVATFGDILTKSALLDYAALDYRGGVRIEKNAVKSESDLNSKNIMLSDFCRVDAIPYLEIETNDVKASHGTSVGQLDEEEIFYLKSRGISEKEAKKLAAGGFFANVLQRCAPKARVEIEKEIGRCLDGLKN